MNTVIKSGSRKGRRNYLVEFKKQLAVAAYAANVSIAHLALDNRINANMLHKWHSQHFADELGTRETSSPNFLEVSMTPSQNTLPSRQTSGTGVIAIGLATATLRLEGPLMRPLLRRCAIDASSQKLSAEIIRMIYAATILNRCCIFIEMPFVRQSRGG